MDGISPDLLAILVCPETHQPLRLAPVEIVEKLKALQADGKLLNRAGQPFSEPLQAALVREDGQYAYPVCDDIPIMLIDEALPLQQI